VKPKQFTHTVVKQYSILQFAKDFPNANDFIEQIPLISDEEINNILQHPKVNNSSRGLPHLSRADLVSCNVREEVINMWIATIKVYNNTLT